MTKLSLKNAKNNEEVCALQRDNFEVLNFWIHSDGYTVNLVEHYPGGEVLQRFVVPKEIFDALADLYSLDQDTFSDETSNDLV